MPDSILILGGYGNFGQKISRALAKSGVAIIIAGRNNAKAQALAASIKSEVPDAELAALALDINQDLAAQLEYIKPAVVINTCGPFQTTDYAVAEACIANHVHYIDLADAREFVTGITAMDAKAKEAGVAVISGASTVPGLSSAVLEKYKPEFLHIDSLVFGISPGAKAPRGLATTQAILTYLGKPLKPHAGSDKSRFGWQDIYRQEYPELGKRWMANCDIPDLDLFLPRYGMSEIRFSAGMESGLLHIAIWLVSWCVRLRLPLNLPKYAAELLKLSTLFDRLGTAHGGMHMLIKGKDMNGNAKEVNWFLIARDGHGPHIPTIPAIILAKKLVRGEALTGAMPCVGLVSLAEYMQELEGYHIHQVVR